MLSLVILRRSKELTKEKDVLFRDISSLVFDKVELGYCFFYLAKQRFWVKETEYSQIFLSLY